MRDVLTIIAMGAAIAAFVGGFGGVVAGVAFNTQPLVLTSAIVLAVGNIGITLCHIFLKED